MLLGNDPALDVDAPGSQQLQFGDYFTQLPPMEAPEDPAATATEPPLFPEGHIFQPGDIAKCILHKEKRVHVTLLKWDKRTVLGQIRPLSMKLVEHYVHRLRANPPRRVVRCLVKAQPGTFYSSAEPAHTITYHHRWLLCSPGRATHQCCTAEHLQQPGRK